MTERFVSNAPAKGARIIGSTRDKLANDLKQRYENGASIRQLAEETGRSYGFIHRILGESGATLRSRGGGSHRKPLREQQPQGNEA